MALLGKGRTHHGHSSKDDTSALLNAAKTLLANIRFISVDDPVRTIAITSAVPNEGKTFVAANLASAIATSGKTVLLVECDMRRRSMASMLGAHAQHGLYEVLSGEIALPEATIETGVPDLHFLDAEPHIPNPSDLLNSGRFTQFIGEARELYDYVVFDTPPVGTFVDAAVLGTKVDAVFMVVREGFTKKHEVAAAAEQLRKSGCNLAGIVMNCCERKGSEYYYEYYYSHEDGRKASEGSMASMFAAGETMQDMEVKEAPAAQEHAPVPRRPERPSRMAAAVEDDLAKELAPSLEQAQTSENEESGRYVAQHRAPAATQERAATSFAPASSAETDDDGLTIDSDIYARLAERARASWRQDDEF